MNTKKVVLTAIASLTVMAGIYYVPKIFKKEKILNTKMDVTDPQPQEQNEEKPSEAQTEKGVQYKFKVEPTPAKVVDFEEKRKATACAELLQRFNDGEISFEEYEAQFSKL